MKCLVCGKILKERGLCCLQCKESILKQLSNLESMCRSIDQDNLGLAYGTMAQMPLLRRVKFLYGEEKSGSGIFRTIANMVTFIKEANKEYMRNKEAWIKQDANFYAREAQLLITFIRNKLI